ncbi:MAG: NUDIX domain-containing protein [Actinomycetota bacterium]|nr:NUDIX domain-containing protein [Actinomycetota bacterium]
MPLKSNEHQAQFALTVDLAIFTIKEGSLSILLIKRAEDPFAGSWALPGGFVDIKDDVEDAARRELQIETGVDLQKSHLEQLGTYGRRDRDPRMRVISVAHVALVPSVGKIVAGGGASAATLVKVSELNLPSSKSTGSINLAFDHAQIIKDAVERVRSKLEYTTLAAALLNEPFSLADVRNVYEAVWGRAPDIANFRRKILSTQGFVEAIGKAAIPSSKGGRPATLYRRGSANFLHPPILRQHVVNEESMD